MKHLFALVILLLLIGCTSQPTDQTQASRADPNTTPFIKQTYEILNVDDHQSFHNFDILVDSTKLEAKDLMFVGAMFKAMECRPVPCNVVTMWTTKRAMQLWYDRNDKPGWRRKNWPYLCEHDAAEYTVSVDEINLFPFLDSEYRRWGGKKIRPRPSSFVMP